MELNKDYLLELAEKREKIAIHTETQEQWNEILDVFRNSKFTCTIKNEQFERYKEESCITISYEFSEKITFSSLEFHQQENYQILSYSDVCVNTKETTLELDKDFLITQRGKGVVVNCKTQEEWNNIIDILNEDIRKDYWNTHKENTCLNLKLTHLTYGSLDFHQKEGSTILSYEDCCKKEIKKELKTINIKIGDEIGKLIITKTALELLKNGEKIRVF